MGKVDIATVDTAQLEDFEKILRGVPITRGDLHWNCQNWVVEALQALKHGGFAVNALSHEELDASLKQAKKDD